MGRLPLFILFYHKSDVHLVRQLGALLGIHSPASSSGRVFYGGLYSAQGITP
jgi:hypothetical protein